MVIAGSIGAGETIGGMNETMVAGSIGIGESGVGSITAGNRVLNLIGSKVSNL